MKRSEINKLQREAMKFLEKQNFRLPAWAYFRIKDWRKLRGDYREIKKHKLGWDVTDFGGGDFAKLGLVIFTIRNGEPGGKGKPYGEKVLIMREGQKLPVHFHWRKMEDIILRAGGNLVFEFWNSTSADRLAGTPVKVKVDGVVKKMKAGVKFIIEPGESACIPQRLYHRFYPEPGSGTALIGEVSSVNDDDHDNRFLEPMIRFPEIEEDEEVLYPLTAEIPGAAGG